MGNGWKPIKGMKIKVKDRVYVVSENAWNISGIFEYRSKQTGKKFLSTVYAFDQGVRTGLIELV